MHFFRQHYNSKEPRGGWCEAILAENRPLWRLVWTLPGVVSFLVHNVESFAGLTIP